MFAGYQKYQHKKLGDSYPEQSIYVLRKIY